MTSWCPSIAWMKERRSDIGHVLSKPVEGSHDTRARIEYAAYPLFVSCLAHTCTVPGHPSHLYGFIPLHRQNTLVLCQSLALRKRDIRPLQESLAALGLSSLGRSESRVLASLHAVLEVLHRLKGREWRRPATVEPEVSFDEGKALLDTHTEGYWGCSRQAGTCTSW